jgi:hypothetical protein
MFQQFQATNFIPDFKGLPFMAPGRRFGLGKPDVDLDILQQF